MPSRAPKRLLILLSVAAILSIGALVGIDARQLYERNLAALEAQLQAESQLLAAHTELSIHNLDLLMTGVAADIRSAGLDALARDPLYWVSMQTSLEHTPHLASLMVANADGEVRFSIPTLSAPAEVSISEHDYFKAHRGGKDHHIGAPLAERKSVRQLIPISIRLGGPNDEFNGVIKATLDSAYLGSIYKAFPAQRNRRIRMYLPDGTTLAHYPVPTAAPALGNMQTLTIERTLNSYPVAVSVDYNYGAFLAAMYPAWLRGGITFIVFATAIGLSGFFLIRSMEKAESVQEKRIRLIRRQHRSERLSRAITRHLPNGQVAVVTQELRYIFVDGDDLNDHGGLVWEAVPGRTIREVHSIETSVMLESLIQDAFAGTESKKELAFRGQTYKVIAVPLADGLAQADQVLLLFQDITELKNVQYELEMRNRELRELSFTDSLLDIANRRAFDHEIGREWRRALRKKKSLALLMVDVDCFKQYNDNYGHAEGDQCLQRVAAALEDAVWRPGDVVARYGGEELAILLPETDLAGALSVAEQIHLRLAEEAIPFPDSPLGEHLTVSIGAAAVPPCEGLPLATLIETADAALYRAKEEGRNRTASSYSHATVFGEPST